MSILNINGVDMPSPGKLEIAYKPNGKVELSVSGDTVMDRLSVKRTITASFPHLTVDAAQTLLVSAVQNANFFDLTIFDPMTGSEITGVFRVSSCKFSPWAYKDGAPVGYQGGTITLEEK